MKVNDGEKIVLTPAETTFIDAFVGEHCVPHEQVVARRLEAWCERMQQAILSAPAPWRLAAARRVLGRTLNERCQFEGEDRIDWSNFRRMSCLQDFSTASGRPGSSKNDATGVRTSL